MKQSRKALLSSVLALLLCFAMLLGTTFAWFTDSEVNSGNIIKSGTLDVEMSYAPAGGTTWKDASEGAIFKHEHWEPGYTEVRYIKVENKGNLAFKYVLNIVPSVKPEAGKVNLADVIDVYMVMNPADTNAITRDSLSTMTSVGTLASLMGDEDGAARGILIPNAADRSSSFVMPAEYQESSFTVGIALKMQEDAGNEYQDRSVGGGFSVQLLATQYTAEKDSFDHEYDQGSQYPGQIDFSAAAAVTADASGALINDTVIGKTDGINAAVPAGVQLADGVTELELSVKTLVNSEANVQLDNGESKQALDIHVEGVAEGNDVAMRITIPGLLKKGLNEDNVKLYHVEGGVTTSMIPAAVPVAHNEFHYDPATGDVTVALQSFSEVAAVADVTASWDGTAAAGFNGGSGTETAPYVIANASQLAYFRDAVDGGNSFAGQYIKLDADIDLCGVNFDPIGWGYADKAHNRDGADGKTFSGTFDGNGNTIRNLYQNGWDLESKTGTDYTYTNCGGGLFASIANGTVKNLTISGANVVMECVEQGILVGLSQGTCTYENINIYNSKIANYQRPAGGLIGEVSPGVEGGGTTTISNVVIGPDVVVGSLWGDFDAPVGGVIGARWDDGDTTKIEMENVTVACRLDVYNDVTSSYQWYAYRRAGMLIGNSDRADGHTATASFLKCKKNEDGTDSVKVYYGPWVNYRYCEFNACNSSWPWVRVEAGENCSAYSNPRWGVATDAAGNAITDAHTEADHAEGEGHLLEIPFGQLYGGGQGIYGGGQTEDYVSTHTGVTIKEYDYTVTYMDRGEVFAIDYVTNSAEYAVKHEEYTPTRTETNVNFKAWVNAGGVKVNTIAAGNITDYVLYDSWDKIFTARFLDQKDNVIYEEEFSTSQTKLTYEPDVPAVDGLDIEGWEEYSLSAATGDIAIRPIYRCNQYVQLNPVDEEPKDGVIDYYQVTGSTITDEKMDIVIPEIVNGIEVKEIYTGAFVDGKLRDVYVPNSIEKIGKNAFAADSWREYPQIQIIFDGTKAEWDALDKGTGWDDNIGSGSVIICTKENPIGYYKQNGRNGALGIGTSIKWEWVAGTPDWYPRAEQ